MKDLRDPYEILGVPEDSTIEDIKASYKKLSLKYHPDTKSGDEEKFKDIAWAYSILSSTEKREQYDLFGVLVENLNDTLLSAAEGIISTLYSHLADEMGDKPFAKFINPIDFIKDSCKKEIKFLKSSIKQNELALKFCQFTNKRLLAKEAAKHIDKKKVVPLALKAVIGQIKENIKVSKFRIKALETVLKLIKGYDFDMIQEEDQLLLTEGDN